MGFFNKRDSLSCCIEGTGAFRVTDSLKQKLEKLRMKYISSLPEKIRRIRILSYQLNTEKWTRQKRDLFINLIHRMVGSGKTFGIEKLSEIAAEFEKFCRKKLIMGQSISPQHLAEIKEFIKKLKTAASNTGKREYEQIREQSREKIKNYRDDIKRVLIFAQEEILPPLADQFKLYGYTLIPCTAIHEVYQYPLTGFNSIIIIDIRSLKSGLLQVDTVRKLADEQREIHLVVLSDDDTIKKRLIAAKCGADIFITTPMDVPTLINKLNIISQNYGSDPYHILIVDDDVEYVAWCAYTLQQQGMITSVISKPESVIPQLIEARPELILMDWHMPVYTGFDLASVIRQQDAFVSIPIVFLTTENDAIKRMKAMSIGVDDFLIKPISSDYLSKAVRIRAERYRKLRFYMERDSLTGLYNHSKILELLSVELSRARRHKMTLSFAMVDIDFFKIINDTYGHLNGDKVLTDLANLFKERLRKNDLIGRYGGEEFAIIFPNTGPRAVERVLNEIRNSFSRMLHHAKGEDYSVTFSAGISTSSHSRDIQTIVHTSDMALYEAKSRGRNKVVFFETI
jgi:diguanylate cyclase (GGDEF)-like protein